MDKDTKVPLEVVNAIEAFASSWEKYEEILKNLRHHPFEGFWSFDFAGMFVGVEKDGYIHT